MQVLSSDNLSEAADLVAQGKVILFPSETSYGLCCDATNQAAVDMIFKIKGRPSDKPLLIVVPTIEMAKKYLEWNEQIEELANKYWPGPLTVVGLSKVNNGLVVGVVAKDNSVALRVTAYESLKLLSEKLGRPVVSTSANVSGDEAVYSALQAQEIFSGREYRPDAIVDYDLLPRNPATTIVSVVGGQINVLRQGEIKL